MTSADLSSERGLSIAVHIYLSKTLTNLQKVNAPPYSILEKLPPDFIRNLSCSGYRGFEVVIFANKYFRFS